MWRVAHDMRNDASGYTPNTTHREQRLANNRIYLHTQ
jgi:hypothetical protein